MLAVLTGVVVVLTRAMSLIRADYHYLWPGLVLLACTAACSDLATVPYNAMLRQLSTPDTSGPDLRIRLGGRLFRQRRCCWSSSISGFISGDGDTRGFLGIGRTTTARTSARQCF